MNSRRLVLGAAMVFLGGSLLVAQSSPVTYREHFQRGVALAGEKKLDEAKEELEKARVLQKRDTGTDDPLVLNAIGWVYYLKGDDIAAVEWLEEARKVEDQAGAKSKVQILNNLGVVYLRQGSLEASKDAFVEALAMGSQRAETNLAIIRELEAAKAAEAATHKLEEKVALTGEPVSPPGGG